MAEIGKPDREIEVWPLEEPVPKELPLETPVPEKLPA